MTNKSYYDDMRIVKELLDKTERHKESNETLYEQYNNLKSIYDDFEVVISTEDVSSKKFTFLYDKLTNAYLSLEKYMSFYDASCSITLKCRIRVVKYSYYLMNKESDLVKSGIILGLNDISPEYISVLYRLLKESKTIGFKLSMEETDILNIIEESLSEL